VLGLPLQTVAETTDITLPDLPEDLRTSVRDGIVATDGLVSARGTVQRLRDRMLPMCPEATTPTVVVPAPPVDPAAPPVETTPLQTVAPEPGTTCRPAT
jgi:protein phosphatase